ncbi:MAG TPA: DUF2020 domain-containing protein [Pseudonocardiaceae bacterium]
MTRNPYRGTLLAAGVITTLGLLTGCGDSGSTASSSPPTAADGGSSASTTASATTVTPPPSVAPARDGSCPYLEKSFVEQANGQRVGRVRLSDPADGEPPACFFYRPDGGLQLTVRVYVGDPVSARALVDQAAPVSTSSPATLSGGWEGGRQPTSDGAVFAVAKEGTALVVVTNQEQTIKAQRVAEQVVRALDL